MTYCGMEFDSDPRLKNLGNSNRQFQLSASWSASSSDGMGLWLYWSAPCIGAAVVAFLAKRKFTNS